MRKLAAIGLGVSVASIFAVAATLTSPSVTRAPVLREDARTVGRGRRATSLDVGAVIEQVHYAFRQRDGAWRGGHSTYEVTRHESGALEVRPWHDAGPRRGSAVRGDSVTFAEALVARGGVPIATGDRTTRTDEKGQLDIARGPVVEHLENGLMGVEQSWRFAAKPEGRGDLEVRIAIAAGSYVGETERGLHFTGGAMGVRYGHGTWIDRLGVRTAVPARWEADAMVLRVPADVVEGSLYPAALDPLIGPEVAMSQDVYGPAPGEQYTPAIAWDGTNHLVVWWDTREGHGSIFAARVRGSDGAVLDRSGLEICSNGSELEFPGVAWDGTANFLVVWDDMRSGDADVYGARVRGSDGAVLDLGGFAISSATGNQKMPSIAWDGANFLVAWDDLRSGTTNDVYAARVSSGGTVLDASGFVVSAAAGSQSRPAIAHGATSSLVVWEDGRNGDLDVYGARVAGGTVLDGAGTAIATGTRYQTSSDVAWNGTDWLVVWQEPRGASSYDICGARVKGSDRGLPGSEGTLLDGTSILVSTASAGVAAADAQTSPAVASNGSAWFVVWQDGRTVLTSGTDIYGARVDAGGGVLDSSGISIATSATPIAKTTPAVAWDGASFLVAWQDYRTGTNHDVYGARVRGSDMAVLDASGIAISTQLGKERYPSVASNGTDYLVVWQDYRNGGSWDVYGARVRGSDASVIDATGIAISTAANDQILPAVAWNGADYLVAWEDHRLGIADVLGARVRGSDGAVLDPDGITISGSPNAQTAPTVACSTAGCLVVWQDGRSDSGDVYGARVGTDGTVLDASGIPISAGSLTQATPVVGWNGTSYVVAWSDSRNTDYDLYAARVSGAGSVLDPSGLAVSTAAGDAASPAIACGPGPCLAVWEDWRSGWPEIRGARIGTAGTVLDPASIGIDIDTQAREYDPAYPAVAWDGKSWTVAWQDYRGGTNWDVYYSRVHATGVVVEDQVGGYPVTPGGTLGERDVALAAASQNHLLAAYDAHEYAATVSDPYRVRARTIVLDPLNLAPTPSAQSLTVAEDTALPVTLSAVDPDGDAMTYAIAASPAHGTLTGTGASLTYAPDANFHGSDSFTFTAADAKLVSPAATVSISVTSVNDAPVASALSLSVSTGNSLSVPLSGSDVDGDPLTYSVVTGPAHGTLGGTPPSLVYTPESGYAGADSFTFKANDGALDSAPATVSIAIGGAGEEGVLSAYGCSSGGGGGAVCLLAGALALALRRTGRRRFAALSLLVLALPLVAGAAPRKEARTRVAVMPIRAGLGTDPKLAELVTDSLAANLTDRGLATITSKDVQSALGFERQRQMLGCGSESCLAEIAGALGADRVVFGDIAQVRGLTIFSAQLFNTRTGAVERRFHERMSGGDAADLLDASDRAAAELFPGTVASGQATRRRSVLTSTAHPLALVARGGYDVEEPGGFGVLMLEYRLTRSLRIGVGALGSGASSYGGAVRAAWYPLVLKRLSISAAAEGHLLFPPSETLVAASVSLGAEWAFTERLSIAAEAPLTMMVSAPEKYRKTYFMPGLAAGWRF